MFNNPVVFSWPAILLGALVFGFLFEALFIVSDYLIYSSFELQLSTIAFGIVAGLGYILAGAIVRQLMKRDEKGAK